MDVELRQRGRAEIDFMLALGGAARPLTPQWQAEMTAAGMDFAQLPDDLDERLAAMDSLLSGSRAFAVSRLVSEFGSTEHGRVARRAYEDMADRVEPELAALEAQGPATLTADPAFEAPDYYRDVWFHRTTGGWDGHRAQGFIHGEIIHKHYVAKSFPGDIFAQRRRVLHELPRRDYARILEMGTSSGHYTTAIQETFPHAEIAGVDISLPMLRQALRTANANGWAWRLHQRAAEDTSFEAASFDLVTSYIIFHEMPARTILACFAEAYRLLKPGGQVLMSDVTPYAHMDKLAVWRADWLARHGGEPYWREAASLDWAEAAREAGFADARGYGIDGKPYPWTVIATKPHG